MEVVLGWVCTVDRESLSQDPECKVWYCPSTKAKVESLYKTRQERWNDSERIRVERVMSSLGVCPSAKE